MPLKVPRRVYDTSLSRQGAAKRAVAKGRALQARANTQSRYRQAVGMAYINPRASTYAAPRSDLTETKYFDTTFTAAVATGADWASTEVPMTSFIGADGTTLTAYTDSCLIPSGVGTGYGQVVGNKYYVKKLRIKGQVVPTVRSDQADVIAATGVRIILVQDMQPNGAQAQGEDIFTDMGTTFEAHYSFLAMAAGSGGRFRILKDKFYMMQPASAGTDGANTNSTANTGFIFKMNYNFNKPIQVQLKANSATPTTASLSNCNIFLIAHATAAISPVINGCARAYYCD